MASLNNADYEISRENDTIVITKPVTTIPGGVTLDTTGYTDTVIKAGQIVAKEKATGKYKPLAISDGAYTTPVSETDELVGVVVATVPTNRPFVSVMTIGQVNASASPVPVTEEIAKALPRIDFIYRKA